MPSMDRGRTIDGADGLLYGSGMAATVQNVKGTVDLAVAIDGAQRIEAPDNEAADWLDRQGSRVLIRRVSPDTYILLPRRAR